MDERPELISSTARFSGRVFSVRTDLLRYPDGSTHAFDVVQHAASCAVIATTADDRVLLVRQFRQPISRSTWEVPAGMVEPGESPVDGALRELAEETGYRAKRARLLGVLATSPGFCSELMYFVHVWDVSEGTPSLDADERVEAASFHIGEAERLLALGEIADMKTLIALFWMRGNRGELVPRGADN